MVHAERESFPGLYHLNPFSGAAAAYRIKGDPTYLQTIIAAYDYFRNKQCLVTGGYGVMERLRDPEGIRELLREAEHSFEVACCSWAGFKLCKSLISFTGEARYGDWIEELMINGISSTIPMRYDGRQHHYAAYSPHGASKENFPVGWYCCTGTRPQAVADYANLIWFHDRDGLYMNLFVPSSLEWKGMHIIQQTVFPEEDKTSVLFSGKSARFVFSFRRPGWLKTEPEVTVNGRKVIPMLNNGWYSLDRKWADGDRVDIGLPMEMEVSHLPGGFDYPAALKYGPVAMAFKVPEGDCPIEALTAVKTAVAGDPLTFHVEGYPQILLRPYYAFGEGERYFLYLDPERSQTISDTSVFRSGTWYGGGTERWRSNRPGTSVEVRFEGPNIRWKGYKDWTGGVVSVTVDGQSCGKVDLWDVTGTPFVWEKKGLSSGVHTLRITLDASEGEPRYMNYSAFEAVE